jgi:dihydrofolate synthase/folylpolyglutamate synthase
VAVFCSIDLDHPELGDTIGEVAREKAGIIKEGATVVVQDPEPEAMPEIERRAGEAGARPVVRGRDYHLVERTPAVGGQRISVAGLHAAYEGYFLSLLGAVQAENAATAIVASEAFLGRALDGGSLRDALDSATSPGRLEPVSRHPLVVLDGAHNPDASRSLAAALPEAFAWQELHLVVGILETKDVPRILAPLAGLPATVHACANANPKALPPDRLAEACRAAGMEPVLEHPTVAAALDAAESAARPEDMILVTGSLYTVADARPRYVTNGRN